MRVSHSNYETPELEDLLASFKSGVCKEFVCLRCSTVVCCVNGNTSDMLTDIPQHHPDEKKHILLHLFFYFYILFTKLTLSVHFHMWQKRILRIKINQGLRILQYGTLCLNPLYVLSPPLSSFINSQCTSLSSMLHLLLLSP